MSYPVALGRVYLVGAGPGDPELLTLKAVRLLRLADVVVYDRLVDERVLQHASGRRVYVGKQRGWHSHSQHEINALLVHEAAQGHMVVRLKGGDPYVFGRGGEEFDAVVSAGLRCDVVPGVTSAIAAPGSAGIPVTHRGLSSMVTIVSGHADPRDGSIDWAGLASLDGTIVILMGMSTLPSIADTLQRHGKPAATPAAVIQHATTPDERIVTSTLANLAHDVDRAGVEAPAVIVIGAVADRARLHARRCLRTSSLSGSPEALVGCESP